MHPIASYHTANFHREATPEELKQRIDRSLLKLPMKPPKHLIQRLIRKGQIRVNGKKVSSNYRLQKGDLLEFPSIFLISKDVPPKNHIAKKLSQIGTELLKNIIYEDDSLLICNKPAGIAVHGGTQQHVGLISALRQAYPEIPHLNLVHRLDKPTSGILMFAKNLQTLRDLHQQFSDNHIKKIYLALLYEDSPFYSHSWKVDKKIEKSKTRMRPTDSEIEKNGKPAQTHFSVIERFQESIFLAKIFPLQGRTHQIRIHALHNQQVILGDKKYLSLNKKLTEQLEKNTTKVVIKILKFLPKNSIYLHAHTLIFQHPKTKQKIILHAPLPDYWEKCLSFLKSKISL